MDKYTDRFRRNLAAARQAQGLTQKRVGQLSGLAQQNISHIEGGIRPNITLKTAGRLARALGMDLHDLLASDFTPPEQ